MLPFAFALASLRETKLFPRPPARQRVPFPWCSKLCGSREGVAFKQFASTSHSLGSQRSHCRHLLVVLAEVLGSMCLSSSSQSDGPAAPRCFIPVWACVIQVSVDSHVRSAEAATFLETLLFGAVSTPGCSLGRRARCNAQRCHCSPCMSTLVFRSSDAVEDQQHEAL